MSDIELVIKIAEEKLNIIKNKMYSGIYDADLYKAIENGIPLPKGHGRIKDVDKFLERVKKDREHEIYLHSWTADMVLERLDSWYAPTIMVKAESEGKHEI